MALRNGRIVGGRLCELSVAPHRCGRCHRPWGGRGRSALHRQHGAALGATAHGRHWHRLRLVAAHGMRKSRGGLGAAQDLQLLGHAKAGPQAGKHGAGLVPRARDSARGGRWRRKLAGGSALWPGARCPHRLPNLGQQPVDEAHSQADAQREHGHLGVADDDNGRSLLRRVRHVRHERDGHQRKLLRRRAGPRPRASAGGQLGAHPREMHARA
mmetsp:Transcript_1852/g.7321  ORF Transcript_1852/g.7321 Transcript_1852/m.7321 type:complete len:213 (-) Transcript_1852:821-1459(-)